MEANERTLFLRVQKERKGFVDDLVKTKTKKIIFFCNFSDSENQIYIVFLDKSKTKTGQKTVCAMQLKKNLRKKSKTPTSKRYILKIG